MGAATSQVDVSIQLPRDLYDEVCTAARNENRTVNDELTALVDAGLDHQRTYQELMARVATGYRAKLASEGKLGRSKDEIIEDLRRVREQVADELDPR